MPFLRQRDCDMNKYLENTLVTIGVICLVVAIIWGSWSLNRLFKRKMYGADKIEQRIEMLETRVEVLENQ